MLRFELQESEETRWYEWGRGELGSFKLYGWPETATYGLAIDAMVAGWRKGWREYRAGVGERPPDVLLDLREEVAA